MTLRALSFSLYAQIAEALAEARVGDEDPSDDEVGRCRLTLVPCLWISNLK